MFRRYMAADNSLLGGETRSIGTFTASKLKDLLVSWTVAFLQQSITAFMYTIVRGLECSSSFLSVASRLQH